MSTRTSPWPAGVPCWVDLTVADVDTARSFYAAVLGWTFDDAEADAGGYAIARVEGRAAAGLGPLADGGPSAWTLYIASDDADATAAAVIEHGGTVVLAPGDVGPAGRMLIAADPAGAVFGVWQAGGHIGAEVTSEPGALVWEDLRSTDPAAARAFYAGVFGYVTEPLPDAGPDYSTFTLPDEQWPLGGIGGMFGQEGPSYWLVYFAVSDADAACSAAEAAAGSVLMRDLDTPFGTMAGIADPFGARFWVVQPPPDQPRPDREG